MNERDQLYVFLTGFNEAISMVLELLESDLEDDADTPIVSAFDIDLTNEDKTHNMLRELKSVIRKYKEDK